MSVFAGWAFSTPLSAQRQELGLGRLLSGEQSDPGGRFDLKSGTSRGLWSYVAGVEFRSSLMAEEIGRWKIQCRAA